MGATLCAPIRSQLLGRVGNAHFRVGCSQMQGFRKEMEDAHRIVLSFESHPDVSFFGVYDGHAGDLVAKHLAKKLHQHIEKCGPNFDDDSLQKAVVEFDQEIGKQPFRNHGSTCVFCLVRPCSAGGNDSDGGKTPDGQKVEPKSWNVTTVNVGDSRAMIVRADGTLVSLTSDHKPETPAEAKRIEAAGGFVQSNRVDGQLAMSRAMGDFSYKLGSHRSHLEQKVIALPDITHEVAHKGDRLLVICDGLVEATTNKQVARFAHDSHKQHREDPAEVVRELLLYSLAQGSTDNHSAILISFEDGTGYDQPDVFAAGPFTPWKSDEGFTAAYLKNAQAWGQTAETLPPAIRQAETTMSADWRETGKRDRPVWTRTPVLIAILLLILLYFLRPFDKLGLGSGSPSTNDEF